MLYCSKNINRKLLNKRSNSLSGISFFLIPTDGLPDIPLPFEEKNQCLEAVLGAIRTVWPEKKVCVHDVLWFLELKHLLILNEMTERGTRLNKYLLSLPGMSPHSCRPIWHRWTEYWHNKRTGNGLLYSIQNILEHNHNDFSDDIQAYFPATEIRTNKQSR